MPAKSQKHGCNTDAKKSEAIVGRVLPRIRG